jgi:hypothetical protein
MSWDRALAVHGPDAYNPIRHVRVSINTAIPIGFPFKLEDDVEVVVSRTFKALLSLEQVEIVTDEIKCLPLDAFERRWIGQFIRQIRAYTEKNGLVFRI